MQRANGMSALGKFRRRVYGNGLDRKVCGSLPGESLTELSLKSTARQGRRLALSDSGNRDLRMEWEDSLLATRYWSKWIGFIFGKD